jgi:hypothetical protein
VVKAHRLGGWFFSSIFKVKNGCLVEKESVFGEMMGISTQKDLSKPTSSSFTSSKSTEHDFLFSPFTSRSDDC